TRSGAHTPAIHSDSSNGRRRLRGAEPNPSTSTSTTVSLPQRRHPPRPPVPPCPLVRAVLACSSWAPAPPGFSPGFRRLLHPPGPCPLGLFTDHGGLTILPGTPDFGRRRRRPPWSHELEDYASHGWHAVAWRPPPAEPTGGSPS
ncbi:Os02g0235101, partial [Oryza sativa Japonica Group]